MTATGESPSATPASSRLLRGRTTLLLASLVWLGCRPRSSPEPLTPDAASRASLPDPVAAPPARYDLDADLRKRLEAARSELGDATASHVEGGVFLLVAAAPGPVFDASVRLVRDALAALFNGRFAAHPTHAVTVFVLASHAAYDAACNARLHAKCPSPYGLYLHGEREAVADASWGVETLTHEITHPILEGDFPATT